MNVKDIKIKFLEYDENTNEIYANVKYNGSRYKGYLRQEIQRGKNAS